VSALPIRRCSSPWSGCLERQHAGRNGRAQITELGMVTACARSALRARVSPFQSPGSCLLLLSHLMQQPVSTMMPTPDPSTPATSLVVKPQRVLACVLCQQRKVKCDRKFPCANCVRSHVQCVPAATPVPRQRRRRFPERELLDRLHHYESLLRHSNIKFEPLHKDYSTTENKSGRSYESRDGEQLVATAGVDESSSPSVAVKCEMVYEAKYALALQESYLSR
jgi:Fungal Zn(2)-Cys(6) binuclear cluster domain